jgi:hypothetical protein
MACRIRDALLVAYYFAQTEQAKGTTALMNEIAPDRHSVALPTARIEVLARKTDLEAHCRAGTGP